MKIINSTITPIDAFLLVFPGITQETIKSRLAAPWNYGSLRTRILSEGHFWLVRGDELSRLVYDG